MKFYVGQEVLCIKGHPDGLVQKGKKYIVNGIINGCAHVPLLLSLDRVVGAKTWCLSCDKQTNGTYFASGRFAPIDNTLSETTVEELLNEPQPC